MSHLPTYGNGWATILDHNSKILVGMDVHCTYRDVSVLLEIVQHICFSWLRIKGNNSWLQKINKIKLQIERTYDLNKNIFLMKLK